MKRIPMYYHICSREVTSYNVKKSIEMEVHVEIHLSFFVSSCHYKILADVSMPIRTLFILPPPLGGASIKTHSNAIPFSRRTTIRGAFQGKLRTPPLPSVLLHSRPVTEHELLTTSVRSWFF